ncbi:MAG: pyruvate kinase [Actinobacteria bacterium]|nr:MAG: pyruvate kinase [Actinomycetota bacterium]
MRRAKIVCTLGPATESNEALTALVEAGMDVARFNLSHGTHADHERVYRRLREVAAESGRAVGLLADLQGPKIRLGTIAVGPVTLVPGERFVITTDECPGDARRCTTTYEGLPGDVSEGDTILIDDGRVSLRVERVEGNDVVTEIVEGGQVSNHKGINLPGVAVSVPALTEKDLADLRWALITGFDIIALSFVRTADDIAKVREVMSEMGIRIPVLAKIEKPQAVANLDGIIAAFDGIMVARGDLGVELPLEDVPIVQKLAITKCRRAGKPVIVATQMLDSMILATRPTRAEVSDVANAVFDGTDAVMLSGETSVGEHPALVVQTMARIIEKTELDGIRRVGEPGDADATGTARALTRAATIVARQVQARYLCTFTETGLSTRLVARHRPEMPILAFTPSERTRQQLSLVWGVETFLVENVDHTDEMVRQVEAELLDHERAELGDRVVIVAGVPPGVPGTTNGLRVHLMGMAGPSPRF